MELLLKKYFWVVNLVVIGICAAFAGRAAGHILEGAYLAGDDLKAPMRHAPPPPENRPAVAFRAAGWPSKPRFATISREPDRGHSGPYNQYTKHPAADGVYIASMSRRRRHRGCHC